MMTTSDSSLQVILDPVHKASFAYVSGFGITREVFLVPIGQDFVFCNRMKLGVIDVHPGDVITVLPKPMNRKQAYLYFDRLDAFVGRDAANRGPLERMTAGEIYYYLHPELSSELGDPDRFIDPELPREVRSL